MVVLCLFVLILMKRLRVPPSPRFIALRTKFVFGVVVVLDVHIFGGHGAIKLRVLGVVLGERLLLLEESLLLEEEESLASMARH